MYTFANTFQINLINLVFNIYCTRRPDEFRILTYFIVYILNVILTSDVININKDSFGTRIFEFEKKKQILS